mmetsp:Transcript_3478/g.4790  ORF Transcript_3478/g.4790 Transcript_3478/m.4790 type:complete len:82 (+) Transcript_3478:165-410(+)
MQISSNINNSPNTTTNNNRRSSNSSNKVEEDREPFNSCDLLWTTQNKMTEGIREAIETGTLHQIWVLCSSIVDELNTPTQS